MRSSFAFQAATTVVAAEYAGWRREGGDMGEGGGGVELRGRGIEVGIVVGSADRKFWSEWCE